MRGPFTGYRNAAPFALLVVALALVAGGFAWTFATAGDEQPDAAGPIDGWRPEVGEPAPDFALVDARDGETVRRLSDYRGQVVVLNWFASWCGPCWAEIPDLQHAHETLSDDLVVIGVNSTEGEQEVTEVIEGTGATYPMLLDIDEAVARHYRVPGMPASYFIDRDGVLRSFGSGRILPETLEEELRALGLDYTAPPDS